MRQQSSLFTLTPDTQGIVVFKFWQSLPWGSRMLLGFGLIALGMAIQWISHSAVAGGLVLLCGNLLLLVSGYNNRVEFGHFDPAAKWQTVERARLAEIKTLQEQIRKWDRSWIDISNPRGIVSFALVTMSLLLVMLSGSKSGVPQIIALDAALLLLPHWLTGMRKVLLLPDLIVKIDSIEDLLAREDPTARGDKLDVLMYLKGGESHLPDDVKIKVTPKGVAADFLGLYGQVVINAVQGHSYPYFYVVLVAQKSLNLKSLYNGYRAPADTVAEFKTQKGVDVLVIRQKTSKTSGYHTSEERILSIFQEGLKLARSARREQSRARSG